MLKKLMKNYKLRKNRKDREIQTRLIGNYLKEYSKTGYKMYEELATMAYNNHENLERIYISIRDSEWVLMFFITSTYPIMEV